MRYKRAVRAALAALAALMQLVAVGPAWACSGDGDPLQPAELIVGGRVTEWRRLPQVPNGPFIPVEVTLRVDRRFRGDAPETLRFIDDTSLSVEAPGVWLGSSGACGLFDEDPTGLYLVLGLTREADGSYRSSRPMLVFSGREPAGEGFQQAMERLSADAPGLSASPTVAPTAAPTGAPTAAPTGAPTAAPTGTPPGAARPATVPWLWLVIGGLLGGVAVLALLWRR
jgi:hypothetical protein